MSGRFALCRAIHRGSREGCGCVWRKGIIRQARAHVRGRHRGHDSLSHLDCWRSSGRRQGHLLRLAWRGAWPSRWERLFLGLAATCSHVVIAHAEARKTRTPLRCSSVGRARRGGVGRSCGWASRNKVMFGNKYWYDQVPPVGIRVVTVTWSPSALHTKKACFGRRSVTQFPHTLASSWLHLLSSYS